MGKNLFKRIKEKFWGFFGIPDVEDTKEEEGKKEVVWNRLARQHNREQVLKYYPPLIGRWLSLTLSMYIIATLTQYYSGTISQPLSTVLFLLGLIFWLMAIIAFGGCVFLTILRIAVRQR